MKATSPFFYNSIMVFELAAGPVAIILDAAQMQA
jgi:hypothetical protein